MNRVWEKLDRLPGVAAPEGMRAAVLVPLYEDEAGDVRVILTKRHDWMRTHAGDVVFPGGMIDQADDGPVATALREAWEEVGIPAEAIDVIGGLSPIAPGRSGTLIVPVVARIARPPALRPQPEEVEAILEPSLVELLDDASWRREDFHGHLLWFYEFRQGTLWGATAFIVQELLSYVR